MQKVSIVLNAILLVAVGYLYYEHYAYINQDEHKLKRTRLRLPTLLRSLILNWTLYRTIMNITRK